MGIRRSRIERLTYTLDGESVWFDLRQPGPEDILEYETGQEGLTDDKKLKAFVKAKRKLACLILHDLEPDKLDYETEQDGVFKPLTSAVPGWQEILAKMLPMLMLDIGNKIIERHWKVPQEVGQANFTKPSGSSGEETSPPAPTVPSEKVNTEPGPAGNVGT